MKKIFLLLMLASTCFFISSGGNEEIEAGLASEPTSESRAINEYSSNGPEMVAYLDYFSVDYLKVYQNKSHI